MKCESKSCSHRNLLLLASLGIVWFSSCCQAAPRESEEVIFYEDPNYEGDRLFLSLGKGCYTMERDWDNKISSADVQGNCVMAYDKSDCKGDSIKLVQGATGMGDFARLRFDNAITSISECTRANGGLGSSSERETGSGSRGGPDFWRVGLEEHNRYRRLHGVSALKGDRQMHDDAQEHADYLAKNNKFEVSPSTKYGENLATSYKKDKLEAVREVVKRWYEKIEYFTFRDPEANKERPKSAQFSSIVWKSTTHMGIGVAKNTKENKWVIVVFYDPAATRTKYRENVPPPVKNMGTESPSVLRTSVVSNFYPGRSRVEYF